jgi:hypothetical protein
MYKVCAICSFRVEQSKSMCTICGAKRNFIEGQGNIESTAAECTGLRAALTILLIHIQHKLIRFRQFLILKLHPQE